MDLGGKGKTPAKVEYWMSYPLMIECPTCGRTYDYSDAEEKFWQKELPPPLLDIRIGSIRHRSGTYLTQKKSNAFIDPAHYGCRP
jgi:hypothetical protein